MAANAKALTASGSVATGLRPRLHGWSIAENAGTPAAAEVTVHDGADATGPLLAHIRLAASGSDAAWFECGVAAPSGEIFLQVEAGTVSAVVYHS